MQIRCYLNQKLQMHQQLFSSWRQKGSYWSSGKRPSLCTLPFLLFRTTYRVHRHREDEADERAGMQNPPEKCTRPSCRFPLWVWGYGLENSFLCTSSALLHSPFSDSERRARHTLQGIQLLTSVDNWLIDWSIHPSIHSLYLVSVWTVECLFGATLNSGPHQHTKKTKCLPF